MSDIIKDVIDGLSIIEPYYCDYRGYLQLDNRLIGTLELRRLSQISPES